ncbi:hypothetical protein DAI22_08g063333 [Oryza sativa Japonica Group]|nr:hypothetical protein DAI22_08g063333 [Oryza sativa Japonica Group]
MDNQSGQPQYGMADHGFRPFSASISAPSTAQQHTGSSSNTAVIQNTIQGEPCQTIFYYQCAQANCMVQKSVARSADGQTTQTFSMGVHNHPQRSVRWLRDGSERLEPMSQVGVLVGASDAAGATVGPSVPETGLRSGGALSRRSVRRPRVASGGQRRQEVPPSTHPCRSLRRHAHPLGRRLNARSVAAPLCRRRAQTPLRSSSMFHLATRSSG